MAYNYIDIYKNIKVLQFSPAIIVTSEFLYLIASLRQKYFSSKITDARELGNKIDETLRDLPASLNSEQVNILKYLLCAAIDEAYAYSHNKWVNDMSLIMFYYQEEFSGENFFTILDELMQNYDRQKDLLAFIYVLLCLGFEGKYAFIQDGHASLRDIKNKIFNYLPKADTNLFIDNISPRIQNKFKKIYLILSYLAIASIGLSYLVYYNKIKQLDNYIQQLLLQLT